MRNRFGFRVEATTLSPEQKRLNAQQYGLRTSGEQVESVRSTLRSIVHLVIYEIAFHKRIGRVAVGRPHLKVELYTSIGHERPYL